MKKRCTKCNKDKDTKNFCKNRKALDGLYHWCKKCAYKQKIEASRTKEGLIKFIYYGQRSASRTRGHDMPTYTKNEAIEWALGKELFHILYDIWVESGYDRWKKPSFDRIDDTKGYSLDNIQIMTWQENKDKEHRDLKSGKLFSKHTPVAQYTLDGKKIAEFVSQQEASRQTGVG